MCFHSMPPVQVEKPLDVCILSLDVQIFHNPFEDENVCRLLVMCTDGLSIFSLTQVDRST